MQALDVPSVPEYGEPPRLYGSFCLFHSESHLLPRQHLTASCSLGIHNDLWLISAAAYVSKLPKGFDWHILRLKEAVGIRNMTSSVNSVLRAIGGDAVGSRNYMLDDDGQSEGIVRYAAPYH